MFSLRILVALAITACLVLLSSPVSAQYHSSDIDEDRAIALAELLRVIQLYNAAEFFCDSASEDGYIVGEGTRLCPRHSADYAEPHWELSLSELLRLIQFFSTGAYSCLASGEDGFMSGSGGACMEMQDILVNEVMAGNDDVYPDDDGDFSDWIELYNPNELAVYLGGWSITDNAGQPRKWVLPEVSIPAEGFLIVWASDKNRGGAGDALHANFKLSGDGEYVGLYDRKGQLVSEIAPGYPALEDNVSFGRIAGTKAYGILASATPGESNSGERIDLPVAEAPSVSPPRGFYEAPIEVSISAQGEDAIVHYTLDGSQPTAESGLLYEGPLSVSSTTVLRAAVFRPGHVASPVETHTYLFGQAGAIAPLSALCITGDEQADLYEPNGIMAIVGGAYDQFGFWTRQSPEDYNNAILHGDLYEREVSVEHIPQSGQSFQSNSGVRVHGSPVSRFGRTRGDDWVDCECGVDQPEHCVSGWTSSNKFSLKLYFREQYGLHWLENTLIPESPLARMRHLVLRGGTGPCHRFLHDELSRRLHLDMGCPAAVGAIMGVYINGSFKGHYNVTQRLREPFFQEAHGSNAAWDVIEEFEEVTEGDDVAWKAMMEHALASDLSGQEAYDQLGQMLDITAFADYLILQTFVGNHDWPFNNWTAARPRVEGAAFRFYAWDLEAALGDPQHSSFNESVRGGGLNGEDSPIANLYRALKENSGFRGLFHQRAMLHLGEGGALHEENIAARFQALHAQMQGVYPDIGTHAISTWMPQRKAIYLGQLAAEGLQGQP